MLYRREINLILRLESRSDFLFQLLQCFGIFQQQEYGSCKECGSGFGTSNDANEHISISLQQLYHLVALHLQKTGICPQSFKRDVLCQSVISTRALSSRLREVRKRSAYPVILFLEQAFNQVRPLSTQRHTPSQNVRHGLDEGLAEFG